MTGDQLETDLAVRALASRLRDWGVKDYGAKARAYVDDLRQRGWKPGTQRAPRHPAPDEECRKHLGQFAVACSGCRSDQLAATPYGHDDTPPDTTGWHPARIRAEIRTRTQSEENR